MRFVLRSRARLAAFGLALALVLPAASLAASFVSSEIFLDVGAAALDVGPPEITDRDEDSLLVSGRRVFDEALEARALAGVQVEAVARAELDVAFTPSRIAIDGIGSAFDLSGGAGLAGGAGITSYQLEFEVDERAPYAFDIRLSTGGAFSSGRTNLAEFALSESVTGDLFRLVLDRSDNELVTTETGFLDPGLYTLMLYLEGDGGDEGFHWGRATIDGVIPEPATGALVAGGLVGLALKRRRR